MSQTPEYPVITPYLIVPDARGLLEFLKRVFNAEPRHVSHREDGETIMHAEVTLGKGLLMIAEATEKFLPSPAVLYVYLDEVDSYYKKGLDEDAESMEEPGDQEYGHRRAAIKDKWGNQWWIASEVDE